MEEEIILVVIYYRDFHGYISTDLLIPPLALFPFYLPLGILGLCLHLRRVYVVNDFPLSFSISPPTTSAIFFLVATLLEYTPPRSIPVGTIGLIS